MAEKSRTKARDGATPGEVGPREPCPRGSGKRYKACHGSSGDAFVARPFAGLAAERDLVALREFVPSATASLTVGDRTVLLGSLLPGAAPAMVRESGDVWFGMDGSRLVGMFRATACSRPCGTWCRAPVRPRSSNRLRPSAPAWMRRCRRRRA